MKIGDGGVGDTPFQQTIHIVAMAIEATFTATEGEFPLAAVFAEFPDAEIELDRVVPTDEFVLPYFWVRDVEFETISMEDVTHPGIHNIRVIDNMDGIRL